VAQQQAAADCNDEEDFNSEDMDDFVQEADELKAGEPFDGDKEPEALKESKKSKKLKVCCVCFHPMSPRLRHSEPVVFICNVEISEGNRAML
jgi:hypothetical protein